MEKQRGTIAKKYDNNRFTKIDIIKNRRSTAFYLNFLPEQHMKPHAHPERELLFACHGGERHTIYR